jgi:5'(3')-deoxyribonucleotidase
MAAAKKVILVDMDGVLVKEPSKEHEERMLSLTPSILKNNIEHWSDIPGIFLDLEPMEGGIYAYNKLSEKYDLYIVSTAAWGNPSSFTEKRLWVGKHLPIAKGKLFLTHNKHMVIGDFIIDDRKVNGVEKFPGQHIHFGQEPFEDWNKVLEFFESYPKPKIHGSD